MDLSATRRSPACSSRISGWELLPLPIWSGKIKTVEQASAGGCDGRGHSDFRLPPGVLVGRREQLPYGYLAAQREMGCDSVRVIRSR
jgi:hypothetical protein